MRLSMQGIILAGLLMGTAVVAQAAGNSIDGKHFGDWGGVCDEDACYVQQVVSKDEQHPLMVTAIGYPKGKPMPAVLIHLPLGIQIKEGVHLQIDENPTIKFQGKCGQDNCVAGFIMDEVMQKQFTTGKRALVAFTPAPKQKAVVLPMSLKGFVQALKNLPTQ